MSEKEYTLDIKVGTDVDELIERVRRVIGDALVLRPDRDVDVPEPPRFEVGAIVSLVSGGPAMTVSAIDTDGEVTCVWFTPDDERRSATFQPDCLEY